MFQMLFRSLHRLIPKLWKRKIIFSGYLYLQFVLRLVFTCDGVRVVIGVVRAPPTESKLKIGVISRVISGVISTMESDLGES